MKDLSIIIVSYNTKELTKQCINKTIQALNNSPNIKSEVIVVDNGSTDGSGEMLKEIQNSKFKIILNNENLGFAKANNEGIVIADGKYILFLNSDVLVNDINFPELIDYLDKNNRIGVLTVKLQLLNGKIDLASHRGFPTIWRSFTYFLGLEKLLGKIPYLSKIFGGYHLLNRDFNTIHEIDSPSGAFYLSRKEILKKVGGFDTRFFMYGEDLDLSFRIKKLGYQIIYYPFFTATHLKYQSGLKKGVGKNYFYEAMKIFYDKHFYSKTNPVLNRIIHFLIDLKKRLSR